MEKLPDMDGMQAYVAFFRGINMGGHNIIRMADLRRAFEGMGFRDVRTVLASGNVLFRATKDDMITLTAEVAEAMRKAVGKNIFVVVRPLDDIRELVDRQPFMGYEDEPGARLAATFIQVNAGTGSVVSGAEGDDYRIVYVAEGVILSVQFERPGKRAAILPEAIEKEFGQNMTSRSWNTILRLAR